MSLARQRVLANNDRMKTTNAAKPSFLKRIWFGRAGLRGGWAILLFFVILAVTVLAIGHIAYAMHHPIGLHGRLTPLHLLCTEAVLCSGAFVATWVMARIEKRSWLSYGLRARHGAAHFAQGLFWGVVVLSAVVGVLYVAGAASITVSSLSMSSLCASGVLWALAFGVVAATEELTFRGYLFFSLSLRWNPLLATIMMSLLFACAHLGNGGENLIGLAQVVAFGLVACLAVWRTGSLWWALGLHAAWDWSETFLFGTADSGLLARGHLLTTHAIGPAWLSGGSVGPEGSVITFVAMGVLALVAVWTLPSSLSDFQPLAS